MTLDTMLLAGAGVLLAALGAARLSSSVGLPSLLLFLFLGVGVGLWVEFDDAALAHDLGFAALVLILGECPVRLMRSLFVDRAAVAGEAVEDLVGGLVPGEGCRVLVPVFDPGGDVGCESFDAAVC